VVNFRLSDDQLEMQDMVRRFAREQLAPMAAELDRDARFHREHFDKMGELGLLGLLVPEQYGGVGASVLTFCVVMEEIAYACAATALSYLAHSVLCAYNLSVNGTEEQKKKYLPDLCSGKKIGCLCITEPGAGSDALGMQTFGEKRGAEWCINGSKTFITNAPVADIFLVYVRTDKNDRNRGISQFIIERDAPGLSTGQPFHKMGNRASPTSEVFFSNCIVPDENVVKGPNQALGILMGNLDVERTVGGSMGVGGAQAAFDKAVKYAREREQFGQPIVMFEMILDKIATMGTEIDAARLLTWRAACLADQGIRCSAESSMAKLFASEMCDRATHQAVQILGGYGYIQEYEVERMMRDAKLGTLGAGTSEIQRLIIAKELVTRSMMTG